MKIPSISDFFLDSSGATAIEYGIIVAMIAVAIVVSVQNLGTTLSGKFTEIDSSVENIEATK